MKATANFDVSRWNPVSSDDPDEGPVLSRIEITKTFTAGDLLGESSGEGLFCGMDDVEAGAGYLVSERFEGTLGDRQGTFVMQHGGLMGPDMDPTTFGSIVPGSGTGQLAGISGSIEIHRTDEGNHELHLEYTF